MDEIFLLCVALTVIGYVATWLYLGREPRLGPLTIRFSPPLGLEPGYLRYLKVGVVDEKALLADLVYLAIAGQIKLAQTTPKFITYLKVTKIVNNWNPNLPRAHKALLDTIFTKEQSEIVLAPDDKDGHLLGVRRICSTLLSYYNFTEQGTSIVSSRPRPFNDKSKLFILHFALFLPMFGVILAMIFPFLPPPPSTFPNEALLFFFAFFLLLALCMTIQVLSNCLSGFLKIGNRMKRAYKIGGITMLLETIFDLLAGIALISVALFCFWYYFGI